ncbi:efflux RND transporter periplasmic adaptor subunit [Solilutibacter silvestris]|uniref:HlyD family secretion protein n=1 Tax=Solilutibacter silvestris TaxID=1645665 RepID=A0A2K1Q1C4_9GAMM|nr:HlyD family efflux transporter periplasmic adaptor subunit [Lysobacter silvestris]PNS08849.1 HlyD family secretion protein [Lysobacter silvestris]
MDVLKNKSAGKWPSWVPSKLRRPRSLIVAVLVAIVLMAVGFWGLGKASPSIQRSELWIDTAVKGDMKREIRASGVLVPKDIRWIVANVPSRVERIVVEPGATVTEDTTVLVLTNPEIQTSLERAQAALSGAESEVLATRASMKSQVLDQEAIRVGAESDWKSAAIQAAAYKRAYEGGAIPGIELKKIEITEQQNRQKADLQAQRVVAAKENMNAQLNAAIARRDQAAGALQIVKQQIESLQVKAGINGILQQIDVEPGQQVEIGAKLARVAKPDALIARVQVPEILAKDLALNLPATIDLRVASVPGKVSRIDPAVRNGSVAVDIVFDGEPPSAARPDLAVEGRILLGNLRNVVSIEKPSLAAPLTTSTLFVLRQGDHIARRARVSYGVASSDRIEIRSGVNAGDQVVLSDTSRWKDEDSLQIR